MCYNLRTIFNTAAKKVVKAQAATYQDCYDKLETPKGKKQVQKITARRKNDLKAVNVSKFINDQDGKLLTQNKVICDRFKE